jgi:uncharacterized protein YuzE
MEPVKVYYDRKGKTLTVWFENPGAEYVCEETADEVILMKDERGAVIGFEKLRFSLPFQEELQVAFATLGEET